MVFPQTPSGDELIVQNFKAHVMKILHENALTDTAHGVLGPLRT